MSPSANDPPATTTAEDGFTLVETLVAVAVFALAFAGIYRTLDSGWRSLRRAADEVAAVDLARSRLAAVGTALPLGDGRQTGETADGLRWTVDARRRASDRLRTGSSDPTPDIYDLRVTVTRTGRPAGGAPIVALDTIKLGERP